MKSIVKGLFGPDKKRRPDYHYHPGETVIPVSETVPSTTATTATTSTTSTAPMASTDQWRGREQVRTEPAFGERIKESKAELRPSGELRREQYRAVPAPLAGEMRPTQVYRETGIERVEKKEEALPIEVRERAPVVHERIRREEVEELQPIIYREREVREVKQITQPIYESELRPVQIHETVLPAEHRPTQGKYEEISFEEIVPTREFEGSERRRVEKPPIIVETIKRQVIEEIQPIIYREIHEPHIIRATKPIYEKVVERPVVSKEVSGSKWQSEKELPTKHADEIVIERREVIIEDTAKRLEGAKIL